MFRTFSLLFFLCLLSKNAFCQVNYTANEEITPYDGPFRYGANLNFYPGWTDLLVADISMGTDMLPGIGLGAFRGSLTEEFLEQWGYDIRVDFYEYYESLGAADELVIAGYPGNAHQSTESFCPGSTSHLFANLYEPIWDNGSNGTPVNEENYYALYLWKMVNEYKDFIKFWEVWNEPDFTWNLGVAYADPGIPGNWWENNPDPCDLDIQAPIFHYIRLLRISWEVIKTVDPDAYVCTGGLGNPAFLDAILRNTDNPVGGSSNNDFPLQGGAYFDVMSFHSYPHFDGSLREFNGMAWDYHRHSDRAAKGMVARKNSFAEVLLSYDYDGNIFPEKLWLISETNLPRISFNSEYLGSVEAQRNYVIKAFVEAQRNNIEQVYFYIIADNAPEDQAQFEFQTMGLFKYLGDYSYPDYEVNEAGIAFKTTTGFLADKIFDETLSNALELSDEINGAAFTSPEDTIFVMWAKTQNDLSELANANYSFPMDLEMDSVYYWHWDHSSNPLEFEAEATDLALTGIPIFIKNKPLVGTDTLIIDNLHEVYDGIEVLCFPNPSNGNFSLSLKLPVSNQITIQLLTPRGQLVRELLHPTHFPKGESLLKFADNLPKGIYWLKISDEAAKIKSLPLVVN